MPVAAGGTLHWDILRLHRGMLEGLRAAARTSELDSVGIDSWGVDYGLLDHSGSLLGNPVHYRDARTAGAMPSILRRVPAGQLYAVTGIQQQPFNTIFQLAAAAGTPQLRAAASLLLIPDLLGYWLTGETGAEVTNASTTQLYDITARTWATGLMRRAGIPPGIFPALRQPGELIGPVLAGVAADAGLRPGLPVVAVGSHDTASAVAAVPASGGNFAYISCGTWSLVGMELDQPVLTEASRRANFTNETGVDGTIRYLRNVMGLWLLQECVRAWSAAGRPVRLEPLLAAAARAAPLHCVIDPADLGFLAPGDMPARIAAACERSGQPARPAGRRSSAASSTAWRSPTAALSPPCRNCPAGTPIRSTSSAAAPGTSCSASSPPMPAACPWWPARPRHRPSATSSSRPGGSVPRPGTWPACAGCSAPGCRCGGTSRPGSRRRGARLPREPGSPTIFDTFQERTRHCQSHQGGRR